MCGRINVSDNEGVRLLLAMLGMEVWPSRDPRFNVTPSQSLDVVNWANDQPTHQRMKWGVMPAWAKPGKFSAPLINARSETVREKPSFKHLVKSHRVIIPINGFYEWKRNGKSKVPYFVTPSDSDVMLVAGLFQPNKKDDQERDQVCVVTVESNEEMAKVHHRMPVILKPDNALQWIQASDDAVIDKLMLPASNDSFRLTQVSDYVNSARNDGPECVAPPRVDDLFG